MNIIKGSKGYNKVVCSWEDFVCESRVDVFYILNNRCLETCEKIGLKIMKKRPMIKPYSYISIYGTYGCNKSVQSSSRDLFLLSLRTFFSISILVLFEFFLEIKSHHGFDFMCLLKFVLRSWGKSKSQKSQSQV